jgi:Xaa-Pro aminopeptidase
MRARFLALGALFLLNASSLLAQTGGYPVFETDTIPPAAYKQRRERVKAALGPKGVAVFFTNPEQNRNNDVDFPFRADSNFLYLTGFEEPDAALLLVPDGVTVGGKQVTEVLFTNVSDRMSETWLGYRMGPENAVRLLGLEAALPNSQFDDLLGKMKGVQPWKTRLPLASRSTLAAMVQDYREWQSLQEAKPKPDLERLLDRMRVIKSPDEIRLIQRAVDASVDGHIEAMRSLEPGMREYHVEAITEYMFARGGCESVGYPSIVGSGPNSTILHYTANRRLIQAGDILCMDAGGEYHGYSADVTRSFPASGKFSPEQRAIYEIVLAATDAGIAQCVAGKSFQAPHQAASEVLARGLIRLGIIKDQSELGRYFMHGTSHFIGLDVHDSQGSSTLAPNMTLTVEPGIYIKAGSPCDKKWWNIGIRIEDDILVTDGAPVNMSARAPRTIAEIERTMAEKGMRNAGR